MSAQEIDTSIVSAPEASATADARKRRVSAYVALMKPRIISLLLVTTVGAMMVAADGLPPIHVVLVTLLAGTLGAGGANAINQFLDRDIDRLMTRTVLRPLPSGAVAPNQALRFGLILALASFFLFTFFVNVQAALLTLAALGYYVLVYTRWLKRSSVHNIVIGGAAGAMPPVIGWAAVTGEVSVLAVYMFAIVFYWTPPHFWALSLVMKREYARAGVPMLPVVRGEQETRRQILLYSLLLVAVSLAPYGFALLGPIYGTAAVALGGAFVWYAEQLRRNASTEAAWRLFWFSILYLQLLFVAMVVDRLVLP